jgi:hypothetical protein
MPASSSLPVKTERVDPTAGGDTGDVLAYCRPLRPRRIQGYGRSCGLPRRLVDELLAPLKEAQLCDIVGSPSSLAGGYRYTFTDRGRLRAEEALARCRAGSLVSARQEGKEGEGRTTCWI